ncbi:hypothetical protein NMG60_11018189 [Bertholletia excelsa]
MAYLRRGLMARFIEECRNMRELKQIHSQIVTSPYLSEADRYFLTSRLLFFCAFSQSGCLNYATVVFRFISNPNLFVYNAMIRAYATIIDKVDEPCSSLALILYKQMLSDGIAPDCLTFPFLLKNCTGRLDYITGRSIHGHAVKHGFPNNVFVQNSLISVYSSCGFLNSARKVFDKMSNRDVVSWNSMIFACLRGGELDLALQLFRKMKKRNNITWNSVITGFVQGGRPKEAIEFFYEMQIWGDDAVRPDKFTVASILAACAALGAIDQGKWVHNFLKKNGLECDIAIGTALVDMYGKCGCLERALQVFREMPKKDIFAWTAMISVFALNGHGEEALDLFTEMEALGVRPNPVTFVGLLSACAHSGLVDKGRWCFDVMKRVYLIEPQVQHYACLVDILSRAGLFNEAKAIIRDMPVEPDNFVWGALLGGCLMRGNAELGEKVALKLIELDPLNHAYYISLCEIYAKADRFNDVKKIRIFMNHRGIKKTVPGCSMIEVDGIVHEFSVKGSPEVLMEKLMHVLNCLSGGTRMEENMLYSIE